MSAPQPVIHTTASADDSIQAGGARGTGCKADSPGGDCCLGDTMSRNAATDRSDALAQIPGGLFVLTANCDGHRDAVLVKWVQPCSDQPPMVMVALAKGHSVEPLIQESRAFALCQISADDRFLSRKFAATTANGDDPLVSLMTTTAPSGSPIVDRALSYLDCEVVRHVELDSDHRIYVGQVHWGAVLNQGAPAVFYGSNGASHRHVEE